MVERTSSPFYFRLTDWKSVLKQPVWSEAVGSGHFTLDKILSNRKPQDETQETDMVASDDDRNYRVRRMPGN